MQAFGTLRHPDIIRPAAIQRITGVGCHPKSGGKAQLKVNRKMSVCVKWKFVAPKCTGTPKRSLNAVGPGFDGICASVNISPDKEHPLICRTASSLLRRKSVPSAKFGTNLEHIEHQWRWYAMGRIPVIFCSESQRPTVEWR